MRRKYSAQILLAIIVVTLAWHPRPVFALTVSPLSFEYDAKPGAEIAGSIKLTNETNATETYQPEVQDFVASNDESGTPKFLGPGVVTASSITTWVSFLNAPYTLQAHQTEEVSFHIHVPESVAPGGYYGGLLFSAVSSSVDQGTNIGSKVGALVIIAVAGDVKAQGSVVDFTINHSLSSHLPITFSTRYENSGDVHLQPTGTITVTNILGNVVTTLPFNPDNGNVLPNSIRRFTTTWETREVAPDDSEIIKEWKNFGLGPYRATLSLNNGTSQDIQTGVITFWIIPWQLILLIVGLITFVLFVMGALHRRSQTMQRPRG